MRFLKSLKTETRIDVLINNAGMGMVGAVEDSAKEDITKLFNLNLIGAVQMMTAVLPKMREQKSGKIINVSSIGSKWDYLSEDFIPLQIGLDKVTEAMRYEVYQGTSRLLAPFRRYQNQYCRKPCENKSFESYKNVL
jgi:NADP-dependent 3-hydroxy acid dehydrogenase YdfG